MSNCSYDHNTCHNLKCKDQGAALPFCFSFYKLSSHLCTSILTAASLSDNNSPQQSYYFVSFNGSSRNYGKHFFKINTILKKVDGNAFLTPSIYQVMVLKNDHKDHHSE